MKSKENKEVSVGTISLVDYIDLVIKEKELTYQQIEDASDGIIHRSYPGMIRSGKVDSPKVSTLQALAKGLGVSEDTLFRVARGLPIEEPGMSAVEQHLLDNFRGMTEDYKKAIVDYSDYLLYLSRGGKGVPPWLKKKIGETKEK